AVVRNTVIIAEDSHQDRGGGLTWGKGSPRLEEDQSGALHGDQNVEPAIGSQSL
ncbi:unnamed protein product, partial [Arctogadus glacialis]